MTAPRWKQLKANTGWGGVVRSALLLLLSVGMLVVNPEPPFSRPALLTALLVPYFLKDFMAAAPERWSRLLNLLGYLLLATAMLGQGVKESLDGVGGVVTGLFTVIALYISLFFWFWSHDEVAIVEQ